MMVGMRCTHKFTELTTAAYWGPLDACTCERVNPKMWMSRTSYWVAVWKSSPAPYWQWPVDMVPASTVVQMPWFTP